MPPSGSINVLHLVHRYTVGGAEAVVNYLCRYSPPNIKNIVCSFYEPDQVGARLYCATGKTICLNKRPGNDFGAVRRLAGIIREKNIDLVHAQAWATYIEGLLAVKLLNRNSCRFVYAFHGKTIADVKNGIPWRRRVAQKFAGRFTDAIIAPSRQMADDYAGTVGVVREQVQVIYNGIDLFCYGRQFKDSRKQLGLGTDEFVVGFVGRLDPVKNLDGLLMAFHKTLERVTVTGSKQHFRLLIVGDGAELVKLQRLTKELQLEKNIIFLGMRDDVALCLSAMDVYVQPSFYEGHSNTILEAMAAGLPVISTYVGGTPEIIKHEHSGLLFQPDDLDGISNAIFTLWHDKKKRQAIAEAGKRTIKQNFSVETMVKAYDDLFCRLTSPL
ncbi:MAG: glycosyltransferase [Deltaproteobacteria bacterium]|jgi:glycosyltransferase involved in cell wall biosynthesis|nr:glycosyltransferase [Deltaproteobacteria bacterium]